MGQIYGDEIGVGNELPALAKVATTQVLVRWAGASGDFVPLHYDDSFARAQGLPGVIIHGALQRQWLIQLVTAWAGDEGTLKKFSCQYRAMDFPRLMKTLTESQEGDTWWCRGTVTGKTTENGTHYVNCEVRVENGKGEVTASGRATIILPSRPE
ncbi:MAG: dehydratase [Chloroflexi bacterium]|nr:dehydratase [Chloroflexota bacterium]